MEKSEIYSCWGCPDGVSYRGVDGRVRTFELEGYCYTFGIWDGECITSSDSDDSYGMIHDDFIVYYVWEHGWKGVMSGREAYNGEYDLWGYLDMPVIYDEEEGKIIPKTIQYRQCEGDDELFDIYITDITGEEHSFEEYSEYDLEDELTSDVISDIFYDGSGEEDAEGWKTIDYSERDTYKDLLDSLGQPVLRGRIFFDYDVNAFNPPGFISIWDDSEWTSENIKKLKYAWGRGIYSYYLVTETDERKAVANYGEYNMPTLADLVNGEVKIGGNNKDKERLFALHTAKPEEKWEMTSDYRNMGDKLNYQKLAYRDHDGNIRTDKEPMTLAQYHNMIWQESRDRLSRVVSESIKRFLVKEKIIR